MPRRTLSGAHRIQQRLRRKINRSSWTTDRKRSGPQFRDVVEARYWNHLSLADQEPTDVQVKVHVLVLIKTPVL